MFYAFVAFVLAAIGMTIWMKSGRVRVDYGWYSTPRYYHPRNTDEAYSVRLLFITGAIITGAVSFIAGVIASPTPPSEYTPHARECHVELVSLGTGNSSEVHGYIGLLGGSVNGEGFQTITYAKKQNGGVVLRQEDARWSVIYEDAPAGIGWLDCKVHEKKQGGFVHFVFPWIAADDTRNLVFDRYEFHVPPGSVVRQFEVAP